MVVCSSLQWRRCRPRRERQRARRGNGHLMRWNPRRSGRQALFRTKSGKFNGVLWWHPHLWSLGIQCNGILLHIMWCIDYSGCIALWNKFVCNFTTFEQFGHYSGGIGTFLTSSLPWPGPHPHPFHTTHTHTHIPIHIPQFTAPSCQLRPVLWFWWGGGGGQWPQQWERGTRRLNRLLQR